MPPPTGGAAGWRRIGGAWVLALLLALGGLEAAPRRQLVASKSVYQVVVSGNPTLSEESRATYEDYLNSAVGTLFSPPITFKMLGVPIMADVFTMAERGDFDFIQGNPTAIACLEEEYGLQSLATRVGNRGGVATDAYGSNIFTRADEQEINTIQDMKDKIVIASTIQGSSGCLFGWKEMVDNGMSLMQEPKQVIFIGNAAGFEGGVSLLEAVLQGVGEVGFMPVRTLEQASDRGDMLRGSDGQENPADIKMFKYINSREVTLGSYTYPFNTSTDLYPEHLLGYLPTVDFDVRTEVARAMFALNESSPAVQAGRYFRWLPPASMKSTRNMMEKLGLMSYDNSKAALTCTRQDNLYDAITCPEGTFKLSKARVESSCADAGLPCPPGYECVCRPCKAARAIEVWPEGAFLEEAAGHSPQVPCSKMGTCLTRQQKEEVRLVVEDNMFRTQLNVTWYLHDGQGTSGTGLFWNEGLYNISFVTVRTGLHLLEVFVDGTQIDDSTLFVEIVQRKCLEGSYRASNELGDCVCVENALEIDGQCVMQLVASKSVYQVVVSGNPTLSEESRATYEDYLNSAVGTLFSPPITFKMLGVPIMADVFTMAERGDFDFIQGNPTAIACLEEEYGLQSLATRVGNRGGVATDVYGSNIFTRADEQEINTIQDMKDKIVIASTIQGSSGCLFGWKEMVDNGMSLMQEPKQVIFIGNDPGFKGGVSLLEAVLQGVGEVGFMPVRALEQASDRGDMLRGSDGQENPADIKMFKYINSREVTLGSYTYPFNTSTDLYPEHSLGYLPTVDFDVRTEVARAMFALNESSPAVQAGRYIRWLPPASMKSTRNMMEKLGLMSYDNSKAALTCTRQDNLYDAITCPEGTFKLSKARVESSCADAGLPCPPGYECVCRPCKAARAIEVRPVGVFLEGAAGHSRQVPCSKMGTCLTRQQKEEVRLVVEDNMFRAQLNVTWYLHDRQGTSGTGLFWNEGLYNISFVTVRTGLHLLVVFVAPPQTAAPPFFVSSLPRMCLEGAYRASNELGDCLCVQNALEIDGQCVMQSVFLPSLLVPLFVTVLAIVICAMWRGNSQADDGFWIIDPEDVKFSEAPEVLGRGSFGLVLKAEYRGTAIAVKRASPPSSGLCQPGGTPAASRVSSLVTPQPVRGSSTGDSLKSVGHQAKTDAGMIPDAMFDIEEGSERDDECSASAVSVASSLHGWQGRGSSFKLGAGGTSGTTSMPNINIGRTNGNDEDTSSVFLQQLRGKWSLQEPPSQRNSESGSFIMRGIQRLSGMRMSSSETSSNTSTPSSGIAVQRRKSRRRRGSTAAGEALFVEEMRFLARLRHPCITTVLGVVVTKECRMLCMELMENGSLLDLIRNETLVLESDMVMTMINDVVQGMRFLHAATPPLVHGDLKAQNILVDSSFKAKISDFGLSQKQKLGITGTPYWMAPEVLRGEGASCASDVYSFGIILYQAISRKDPYEGENITEVLHEVAHPREAHNPKRPVIPESCPAEIAKMMELCWQSDPKDRPAFQRLEEVLGDMDIKDLRLTMMEQIRQHKRVNAQSEKLLLDVFPKHIAEALVAGKKVEPEYKECVTIFFSDIVGFTEISGNISPDKVSSMLDRLYTRFDALSLKYEVFKVETIGDAYMAVTNLVRDQTVDHASRIAQFALECVKVARQTVVDEDDPSMGCVNIRVGFHSGPIVARVVGTRNPRYCLFGDTVNIASRMESVSVANRINCSKNSARYLRAQLARVNMESRGLIDIKGKGKMETFWVRGMEGEDSSHAHGRRKSDHGQIRNFLGLDDVKLGVRRGSGPLGHAQNFDRPCPIPGHPQLLAQSVVVNGTEGQEKGTRIQSSHKDDSPEGSFSNDGTTASRGSTSSAGPTLGRVLATLPTQGVEPDGSGVTEAPV